MLIANLVLGMVLFSVTLAILAAGIYWEQVVIPRQKERTGAVPTPPPLPATALPPIGEPAPAPPSMAEPAVHDRQLVGVAGGAPNL
jgi:hypothetical protein